MREQRKGQVEASISEAVTRSVGVGWSVKFQPEILRFAQDDNAGLVGSAGLAVVGWLLVGG
jgi:hypothetical protein